MKEKIFLTLVEKYLPSNYMCISEIDTNMPIFHMQKYVLMALHAIYDQNLNLDNQIHHIFLNEGNVIILRN
jgi:hypothetical protein